MNLTPDLNDAHILIVDDDERIRGLLQKFLARNGFFVSAARDAAHARRLLAGLEFDMIVLDVMMPGEDGLTLTRDLRKTLTTPILLLTAKAEADERINGLEAGADDYLTKPFEPKELVLRINSILRRVPKEEPTITPPKTLQMGEIRYDVTRGELWQGESLVKLTATEAALMRIFSAMTHSPVSRATASKAKSARWMYKSPACAANWKPIQNHRAICKPCVVRDICWRLINGNGIHHARGLPQPHHSRWTPRTGRAPKGDQCTFGTG